MSEDIRKRLHELRRSRELETDEADADEESAVSVAPYGQVGLNRRAELMLELRKKDGNCKAFSYGYLVSIDFNSSQGILLHFVGCRVKIAGRQLRPLVRGLVCHRVSWIQEEDDLASREKSDGITVVTSIEILTEK